jgi:hypothetical protein
MMEARNKMSTRSTRKAATSAPRPISPPAPEKQVHIYRPNTRAEILKKPKTISGEPLLRGFELDLAGILT